MSSTELHLIDSMLTINAIVGCVLSIQRMRRTRLSAMVAFWVAWNPPVLSVTLDTNGQPSCRKCKPSISHILRYSLTDGRYSSGSLGRSWEAKCGDGQGLSKPLPM